MSNFMGKVILVVWGLSLGGSGYGSFYVAVCRIQRAPPPLKVATSSWFFLIHSVLARLAFCLKIKTIKTKF